MDKKFIELLKPQNIFMAKKRIGPPEDGGYVVPEFILDNCSALFTYGVGNEIRFEDEFCRTYNKPAYMFDHTTGSTEWERNGMHFYPEGLGFGINCKDFVEHYERFQIKAPVFLKIDIEGGEYEYFMNTDISNLEHRVMGMFIEVHWFDNEKTNRELINILTNIEKQFILCHIHGNNWGDLWDFEGLTIPKVLELTFINKKFVEKYEPDTQDYPIKDLDIPNRPGKEDYDLSFLNTSLLLPPLKTSFIDNKSPLNNIIVTLTTIPSRLTNTYDDNIMSCLISLMNQSHSDYEIHFNIPYNLKHTGEEYFIPDKIYKLQSDKFKIFRTDDLGPATKLIPTVERITDPETIIIVVDDDIVYHEDLIKEHIQNRIKWPECPVGYDGMRSKDSAFNDSRDYYFSGTHQNSRVDILQHYKSVSYKRKFFEDDFFDFVKENFSWDDDLMIAAYFSHKKRDRIVTYLETDPIFQTFDEWLIDVGTTFPMRRSTQHGSDEGCNNYRDGKVDDRHQMLYKFIDNGYIK
jgi:hypothetical protein